MISNKSDFVFPPGVQICDKKTEMRLMKVQLEKEKAKYEDTYRDLKLQEDHVERDETEFKALVARHDDTVFINLEKRRQAKMQAEAESRSKSDKDLQLAKLDNTLKDIATRKESLLEESENLQFYHQYMLEVWRVADGEFDDVSQIISRYGRFRETYRDLGEREEVNASELAKKRNEFAANYERTNTEIVELTNTLNTCEKQIEDLQREASEWEGKLNQLQIVSSNKNLLLGQIKMAIDNLFYIVNKYIKIKRGGENSVEKLDKIQAFIFDLDEVVEEVPRMVTNSNSLSSFFKEKAWHARGGEDSNFDYNNPLSNAGAGSEGGDPPEFNPFKKSHWDRVRAIGGISTRLNAMFQTSQKTPAGNSSKGGGNSFRASLARSSLIQKDSQKSRLSYKTVASTLTKMNKM